MRFITTLIWKQDLRQYYMHSSLPYVYLIFYAFQQFFALTRTPKFNGQAMEIISVSKC